MAETLAPVGNPWKSPAIDARIERSQTDLRRFATLAATLALLLVAFKAYGLEQPAFFTLACIVFGGFAVSYWLPFRFKETFLILLSLGGAYVLLGAVVASLLIAMALVVFGVVRSGLSFRWKVIVLFGILACSIYGRATGRFPIPGEFWPVFGAVFMFRTIIYLYDVKHMKSPARLKDLISYFFLLPNYYFLFFPVVDFQTFQKSYFKRDIHIVAQQGIWWIFRGVTQLLLYRLIYQTQGYLSPPKVPVPVAVVVKIVFTFLLYMRISGQFHIIAGMLCLFGYDMPETNRRYLLATSLNDFWRRANIYWKDFMVKIFYFPAYFKMRRNGELKAQLLATMLVFAVTWFLHAYQYFWLQGQFRITYNDSLFWLILGSLVVAEVWITSAHGKNHRKHSKKSHLRNALQIAATFTVLSVLWSMWSANSLAEWVAFLKTGNA
jgi:alginate O-acetyltransferase complex protein AlgI